MPDLRTSARLYADQADARLAESTETSRHCGGGTDLASVRALEGIGYALLAIHEALEGKGNDITDAVSGLGHDVCAELGDLATTVAPLLPSSERPLDGAEH